MSTKTRKHVNKLCKAVVSAAHGSSFTREAYPRSFFQLESLITGESINHSPPLVSMAEFDAMADSCGIHKGEMPSALLLLSQLGMQDSCIVDATCLHEPRGYCSMRRGRLQRLHGDPGSTLAHTADGHLDHLEAKFC